MAQIQPITMFHDSEPLFPELGNRQSFGAVCARLFTGAIMEKRYYRGSGASRNRLKSCYIRFMKIRLIPCSLLASSAWLMISCESKPTLEERDREARENPTAPPSSIIPMPAENQPPPGGYTGGSRTDYKPSTDGGPGKGPVNDEKMPPNGVPSDKPRENP